MPRRRQLRPSRWRRSPNSFPAVRSILNITFGEASSSGMLLALDESQGDGRGYDCVYIDQNMDGVLADHAPTKFALMERGSEKAFEPRFSFTGPCPYRPNATAKYEVDLYALRPKTSKDNDTKSIYFFWWLTDNEGWSYFFINGKVELYATAAEALVASPSSSPANAAGGSTPVSRAKMSPSPSASRTPTAASCGPSPRPAGR